MLTLTTNKERSCSLLKVCLSFVFVSGRRKVLFYKSDGKRKVQRHLYKCLQLRYFKGIKITRKELDKTNYIKKNYILKRTTQKDLHEKELHRMNCMNLMKNAKSKISVADL